MSKSYILFHCLGRVNEHSELTLCYSRCVCASVVWANLCSVSVLQDLSKQLDEVTQDAEIVEIRQKEAECELEATRDRVQQQATEILLKASELACHPPPHLLSISVLNLAVNAALSFSSPCLSSPLLPLLLAVYTLLHSFPPPLFFSSSY